jgi:hypothetical protein
VLELAAAAAKSTSAWDEPGTLGFLVVFGMGIILYFVFRSLAKHLRKLNEAARLDASRSDAEAAGTAVAGTAVAGTGVAGAGEAGSAEAGAGSRPGASRPERS